MPIVILLWAVGWSIFRAESKEPRRLKVKSSTQKDLTFIVPMPEQMHTAQVSAVS